MTDLTYRELSIMKDFYRESDNFENTIKHLNDKSAVIHGGWVSPGSSKWFDLYVNLNELMRGLRVNNIDELFVDGERYLRDGPLEFHTNEPIEGLYIDGAYQQIGEVGYYNVTWNYAILDKIAITVDESLRDRILEEGPIEVSVDLVRAYSNDSEPVITLEFTVDLDGYDRYHDMDRIAEKFDVEINKNSVLVDGSDSARVTIYSLDEESEYYLDPSRTTLAILTKRSDGTLIHPDIGIYNDGFIKTKNDELSRGLISLYSIEEFKGTLAVCLISENLITILKEIDLEFVKADELEDGFKFMLLDSDHPEKNTIVKPNSYESYGRYRIVVFASRNNVLRQLTADHLKQISLYLGEDINERDTMLDVTERPFSYTSYNPIPTLLDEGRLFMESKVTALWVGMFDTGIKVIEHTPESPWKVRLKRRFISGGTNRPNIEYRCRVDVSEESLNSLMHNQVGIRVKDIHLIENESQHHDIFDLVVNHENQRLSLNVLRENLNKIKDNFVLTFGITLCDGSLVKSEMHFILEPENTLNFIPSEGIIEAGYLDNRQHHRIIIPIEGDMLKSPSGVIIENYYNLNDYYATYFGDLDQENRITTLGPENIVTTVKPVIGNKYLKINTRDNLIYLSEEM